MITQYTRFVVYFDPDLGIDVIDHVVSQDYPFADGWEPVDYDPATHEAIDVELTVDEPYADFKLGVDQPVVRARKLIENMEIVNKQPKTHNRGDQAVKAKITKVSPPKSIEAKVVKPEMLERIRAHFIRVGITEADALIDIRANSRIKPDTLEEMSILATIRIERQLEAMQDNDSQV